MKDYTRLRHLDDQVGRVYRCPIRANDCAGREAIPAKRTGRLRVVDAYQIGTVAVQSVKTPS
jgi:hypothetical protein